MTDNNNTKYDTSLIERVRGVNRMYRERLKPTVNLEDYVY